MRRVEKAEVVAKLDTLLHEDHLAAQWLYAWLQPEALDATLAPELLEAARSAALSPVRRAKVSQQLDEALPHWRQLGQRRIESVGHHLNARPERPALAVGRYPLETSGCGEMALRMAIESVQVVEREDNILGDKIYCVIRAQDDTQVEVLQTDPSPALGVNGRHDFEHTIFYGRAGHRDPGQDLKINYDCYEIDDDEDYERISEIIDELERVGVHLGKLTGTPQAAAFAVQIAEWARIVAQFAAIFDGDDHLYIHEEILDRRALWRLMTDRRRTLVARDENNLSEWSWVLSFRTDGCAMGVSSEEPAPSGPRCSETCVGCCVGERCVTATDNQACGSDGASCRSCQGADVCTDGVCTFDVDRVAVDLSVVSAHIERNKSDGRCWDLGGCGNPPDVYISVDGGGCQGATPIQEAFSPAWGATVCPSLTAGALLDGVFVRAIDDDLQSDDLIGECWFYFTEQEIRGFSSGRVEEKTRRCGAAEITLGIQLR
ncbi:MAG: hypothetical protein ACE366_22705 [Bradymonadia bacterium]